MDAMQELVELEALKRLKARYFLYMDTKQWELWLALYAQDATLEWDAAVSTGGRDGQTSERCNGVGEIDSKVVQGALKATTTVHHGHTPLLEVLSEDEARGIWAMEDLVVGPMVGADLQPTAGYLQTWGYGHYHETYRKIDGEWKFATIHLTRLRVSSTLL